LPERWRAPDLASLRHLQVGALRDSVLQTYLAGEGFAHIEPAINDRVNAVKLNLNRIQAWAALASVADHWLARESMPAQAFVRLEGPELPLYLAATRDIPTASLAPWVEAAQLSQWHAARLNR
jgi:hypothetical protein